MAKSPKLDTVYHHMDFPTYEYREYPKHVQGPDGKTVEVLSEEEEAKVMASTPIVREEDERARLIKVAEIKGVQVDRRWRLDRMAEAITAAGYDANLNPDA